MSAPKTRVPDQAATGPRDVLLMLASLLVTLLIFEIGFRLYDALVSPREDPRGQLERAHSSTPPPAAPDCRAPGAAQEASYGNMIRISEFPDIVYEFKPGITVCAFARNRVTINRAGFRAPRDYSLEKPPGTFRIVGLGDSYMFGMYVEDDETYLQILEQKLWARGVRAETINTALPGYNTAQEAAVLAHHGMSYHPDLVIYGFVGNDLGLPNFLETPVSYATLRRSHFLDFVLTRIALIPRRHSLAGGEAAQALEAVPLSLLGNNVIDRERVPEQFRYMVGVDGFRRGLTRMKRVAGSVPVLILGPFPNPLVPPQQLEQIARDLGFLVAPSAHYFPRDQWVNPSNNHPNRRGHETIADNILRALEEKQLLPR